MRRFWLVVAWGFQLSSLGMVASAIVMPRLKPQDEALYSGVLLLYAAILSAAPALIAELLKNKISKGLFRWLAFPAIGWFTLVVLLHLVAITLNLFYWFD